MSVYNNLTNFEKEFIEDIYSISIKKIENINSGILNSNFYIFTDNKKYVLIIFEETRDYKEDEQELILLEKLKNIIPVSTAIKNKKEEYISVLNNKKFSLFEYINGESIKKTNQFLIREIGRYLGKFHRFTANIKAEDFNRSTRINFDFYYKKIKETNINFENKNLILEEAKKIENINFSDLPSGIIHSDIFPDNVLMENNKINAIIDFNESYYAPFIIDLAIVINFWIKIFAFDKFEELELIRDFFNNYSQFRKITKEELKNMDLACKKVALTFVLLRAYKEKVEKSYDTAVNIEKKSYLDLIKLI